MEFVRRTTKKIDVPPPLPSGSDPKKDGLAAKAPVPFVRDSMLDRVEINEVMNTRFVSRFGARLDLG